MPVSPNPLSSSIPPVTVVRLLKPRDGRNARSGLSKSSLALSVGRPPPILAASKDCSKRNVAFGASKTLVTFSSAPETNLWSDTHARALRSKP